MPIVAHHLAQPDKGTGIAMICTFGDITDVIWWRELNLPTRAIIGRNGRVVVEPPEDVATTGAAAYAAIAGQTMKQAQRIVVPMALRWSDSVPGPGSIRSSSPSSGRSLLAPTLPIGF